VVINNAAEDAFLLTVKSSDIQSSWLGYYQDNNAYIPVDGTTLVYTNWKSGQPATQLGCVDMVRDPTSAAVGKWKTEDCSTARTFICKITM
jgi:hypothetical protein